MSDVLDELHRVLEDRKAAPADSSYVAGLYDQGLNKILEKVGEECTETLLAAKDAGLQGNGDALVSETADLWFHTIVMLSHLGLSSRQVLAELERRFGLSGLEEKAARSERAE